MSHPKHLVTFIVRTQDRLEYTIECLDDLAENFPKNQRELIIVDDRSTDGTHEWFKWVENHSAAYNHFGPWQIHYNNTDPPEALGDWGGLVTGISLSQGLYICQLDNDMTFDKGTVEDMMTLIDSGEAKVVMATRRGVKHRVGVIGPPQTSLGGIRYGRTRCCTGMYMLRRDLALRHYLDHGSARPFTQASGGRKCVRLLDRFAYHAEGWKKGGSYKQLEKYPKNRYDD